jgi:phosphoglycerate dehydrogenase-like enzyme
VTGLKIAHGYPISQSYVDKLTSISGVELVDVGDLLKQEKEAASSRGPDSPEAVSARQAVDAVIGDMEIYYSASLPDDLQERAPKLKWLQYVWDGIDLDIGPDILESPIVVTNARQLSNVNIAEWVMMCILMFSKKQHRLIAERREKFWSSDFYDQIELENQTVGVVGLGAIGGDVARLCKAFGMTVLATRRTVTNRQFNVGDVDEVMPATELDDLLKRSDYIALCVPGTPGTRQIITERELDLIGPSSFLINIARGSVIDEPALTRALKENRIAGAGLDVFAEEPLPQDSELWDLDNVIFASHKSGDVFGYDDRVADLFTNNVQRYIKGEELINLVDKKAGY